MGLVKVDDETYSLIKHLGTVLDLEYKRVVKLAVKILKVLVQVDASTIRSLLYASDVEVLTRLRKMLTVATSLIEEKEQTKTVDSNIVAELRSLTAQLQELTRMLKGFLEKERRLEAQRPTLLVETRRVTVQETQTQTEASIESGGVDLESNPWVRIIRRRYMQTSG